MRTWVCLLVLVVACGDKKDPSPATGSGTGSAVVAAPAGTIEVFVNDASVAKVTAAQIASWPRLDSLLPEDAQRLGTWQVVLITGADPKPAELNNPSSTYPQMVPRCSRAKATYRRRMFDPIDS